MQKTKVSHKGQIKIPEYEIFEVVRKNAEGGSILTAIHTNLNPVYISGGEDCMEILVVQAKIGIFDCRYASAQDKIAFYARLDQEVKNYVIAWFA